MTTVGFWYDFASSYSYLTAMRVEAEATRRGVGITWEPFLLGPIFARQGWTDSPFNLFPAKGMNMWRDLERSCDKYGLPLVRPDVFPQNGLTAARLALLGKDFGWTGAFTRAVFHAEFGEGKDISQPDLLAGILTELGLDADELLAETREPVMKEALKDQGREADRIGLYGAPSFVTSDGELFWGNDRMDDAFDWQLTRA
ncbi:2-hydroxychromene-2-carboxylate isomerase [Breoghania sp. L-A4]|uniref:2-hydroxychromene-2-carboxylate isomerase n=1 Tax=Breoghania sp. L-A4 TaxID=2304600 RepID=UPI000E35929B|nr:2-hydroxychromene-2-carboxylate isomerase [Breoghania sp. L-A4]AXS38865.1 2-hydroxychromene-2-carboxylate isomerase [Breoghania sp. L-A4]